MSLDVYLIPPKISDTDHELAVAHLRAGGFEKEACRLEMMEDTDAVGCHYSSNITHNLNTMAEAAGIYKHLWRPDEIGITTAEQLIVPLKAGLALLKSNRRRFENYNASNGFGKYEHFVPFVAEYLAACEANPKAIVSVSR